MLTNLFNTLLISLGTGASLINAPILTQENRPNLTPQIQRVDTRDYTLELTVGNNIQSSRTDISYNYTLNRKHISGYNNGINVVGTVYYQTIQRMNQLDYPINQPLNEPQYYSGQYWQENLIVLQITPYNMNVDTTTSIRINYNINNVYVLPSGNYVSNAIIQSTENLATWIDSNYFDTNLIGNAYINLTSPTNGYNYMQTYTNHDVSGNNKQFSEEITINPRTNNYIFIFMQPTLLSSNGVNGRPNTGYVQTYMDGHLDSSFTVNGTYVIPTGTTEVVDIPSIMFDVLTMPFTFISIAFNLTLFPGTPYQINISNLFLILIAVAVFAFLMSILLKAAVKNGG